MLRTVAINFESGAYSIQTEGEYKGLVDQDDDKVANILRSENPIIIGTVIEELKYFATLPPNDLGDLMSFGNASGIIDCIKRYKDPKFIRPLNSLIDQYSCIQKIFEEVLSKID
jgi:hypothetical protein